MEKLEKELFDSRVALEWQLKSFAAESIVLELMIRKCQPLTKL